MGVCYRGAGGLDVKFWTEFWDENRDFTLSVCTDVYRWVLTVVALLIIFGILKIADLMGYDHDLLTILEKLDFVIMAVALMLGGIMFLGKLWAVRARKQ